MKNLYLLKRMDEKIIPYLKRVVSLLLASFSMSMSISIQNLFFLLSIASCVLVFNQSQAYSSELANKSVTVSNHKTPEEPSPGANFLSPHKKKQRSGSLDFDDEFVEGVNKRPLDSLNQISDGDQNKSGFHLYDKTNDFLLQNAEALRYLRYLK